VTGHLHFQFIKTRERGVATPDVALTDKIAGTLRDVTKLGG